MQVRQLYTAPTLIRSLEAIDDKWVTSHDLSSLKVLGTVGEPIGARAWNWFFDVSPGPACPRSAHAVLRVAHAAENAWPGWLLQACTLLHTLQ